jgi:hypothetical protein
MPDPIDEVLDKLAKNVEAAVHALYRGDTRQETAKARTGQLVREAAELLRSQTGGRPGGGSAAAPVSSGRPSAPAVAGGALGWSREEGEAVMKCVTAWQPMGAPASAPADSKCISSGREMVPTWSERELARAALKKITAA